MRPAFGLPTPLRASRHTSLHFKEPYAFSTLDADSLGLSEQSQSKAHELHIRSDGKELVVRCVSRPGSAMQRQ